MRVEIIKAIHTLAAEIEEEELRKRAEAIELQRKTETDEVRRACDELMEAIRDVCRYFRKYGFNPDEPRVPRGNFGAGQWTNQDWASPSRAGVVLSDATPDNTWKPNAQYAANEPPPPGIGHNQGPPLEDPPEIPELEPPFGSSAFWNFVKAAARWLVKAGWRPLFLTGLRIELEVAIGGRIGLFLLALEAAYWSYKAYPYIRSYFDSPKTLEELRQNTKPGYDDHHVVEQWSTEDRMPRDKVSSPDNVVRIPTLKHWEINGWLGTPNEEFKDALGNKLTPRQYMRGKSWEERYQFGLKVLRDFGVLKP